MKLSNMATVLRAAGLTVEETPGWAKRGYAGQDLAQVRGVLWHHTATGRAAFTRSDAPTLNLCINGRSDLPGPLCNIVLGRDGTVYLVAAGVANHAGVGQAAGIPDDMGNHYLIGIEMESSGVTPWDWTADQLRVAPHLGAALERAYLGKLDPELRLQLGHMEYSTAGKIDPAGWPGGMDGLRASINKVLDSGAIKPAGGTTAPASTKETGMAVGPEVWTTKIQEYKQDGRTKADGNKTAGFILGQLNQWVTRILAGQATLRKQNDEILARLKAGK